MMAKKGLKTVLEKIECKECGKKVEVIHVVGDGVILKYAPCKNCYCQNVISSRKWQRGPAEVDVTNEKEIIQYIRDLLNLADLLENGFDSELLVFIKTLKKAGYGDDYIDKYITYAGRGSRFETLVDGNGKKLVPRAIPSNGDYKEWLRLKQRAR